MPRFGLRVEVLALIGWDLQFRIRGEPTQVAQTTAIVVTGAT